MTMVQSMVTSTTTPLVANRYVVEEELASGGMGVVYRVHDRSTGEKRALKRLKSAAPSCAHLAPQD